MIDHGLQGELRQLGDIGVEVGGGLLGAAIMCVALLLGAVATIWGTLLEPELT